MIMILFLAVLILSIVNGAWLLHRLQNTHISTWIALGRPTFAMTNGVLPRIALIKYIWSLHFRVLADPTLSVACWAAITSEFFLVCLMLLFVIGVGL